MSSSISKFSTRIFSDALRHRRFDLEQRRRAVTQLLERPIHRLEQVVGVVLADLDVGVANHAEQVRPDDSMPENSCAQVLRG